MKGDGSSLLNQAMDQESICYGAAIYQKIDYEVMHGIIFFLSIEILR